MIHETNHGINLNLHTIKPDLQIVITVGTHIVITETDTTVMIEIKTQTAEGTTLEEISVITIDIKLTITSDRIDIKATITDIKGTE